MQRQVCRSLGWRAPQGWQIREGGEVRREEGGNEEFRQRCLGRGGGEW